MKNLSSFSEVESHFEGRIKLTGNTRLVFKTANRTVGAVDSIGGKKYRMPFPVLILAKDANISDFLADIKTLGYNRWQILRDGLVLYFSKKYVPNPMSLNTTKNSKTKAVSESFRTTFLAELDTEDLVQGAKDGTLENDVQTAWKDEPVAEKIGDFVYVNEELSTELNQFADALLKGVEPKTE